MQFRNLLFCLSILFWGACGTHDPEHASCEAMADSLRAVHQQTADSLIEVINIQKTKLENLQDDIQMLEDSLASLPPPKKPPRIVEDTPRGDPTPDPMDE